MIYSLIYSRATNDLRCFNVFILAPHTFYLTVRLRSVFLYMYNVFGGEALVLRVGLILNFALTRENNSVKLRMLSIVSKNQKKSSCDGRHTMIIPSKIPSNMYIFVVAQNY